MGKKLKRRENKKWKHGIIGGIDRWRLRQSEANRHRITGFKAGCAGTSSGRDLRRLQTEIRTDAVFHRGVAYVEDQAYL